jgi:hypothetical protein
MNALAEMQHHALLETAARDLLVGIGPFVAGILIVALLIGAVRLGIRRRATEPPPPSPDEQPQAPPERAHIEEIREADDEAFPADGRRLMPYELKQYGSHAVEPDQAGLRKESRAKDDNSGGAFGSGGPGA